jgi:CBS domain-containing protein
MERLAVVVRFKPELHEQVEELLRAGPPLDLSEAGIDEHAVFLTPHEAVFVFAGPEIEWELEDLTYDFFKPELQEALVAWRTVLDEDPHVGRLVFSWSREEAAGESAEAGLGKPAGVPPVQEVMRSDVVIVAPEDTLGEIVEKLVAAPEGPALVVDHGRLIGIVSADDVLRAVAQRVHPSDARARVWMSEASVSVAPSASSEEAALAMVEHGLHHLPVVEHERPVGIVSLREIVRRARAGDLSSS